MGETPYYRDPTGQITLYCGDAADILTGLPPADLCLTDPNYGHGSKWAGGTWASNPMYADAMKWDAEPVSKDLMDQVLLCAKYQIIWGGNYYSLPPSRCWLAWEKSSKMDTLADFELAWTNLDKPAKLFLEDRNPNGMRRYHPTQKALSLFIWCIRMAPAAATIIDPFVGSGTTLVAAKRLGLSAIGIEQSESYCRIAVQRLERECMPMFDVEPSEQLLL